MSYTAAEHRHRFAVWTAARATNRNFTKTTNIRSAVEMSGVREFVESDHLGWPRTAEQVDRLHREWANLMLMQFEADGIQASYGQAAKLIAIYLKTAVIIPAVSHPFADLAHPPIDDRVLSGLRIDPRFSRAQRSAWRTVKWTKLDEQTYFDLIDGLRTAALDRPSFWMIERYWQPEASE